MSCICLAFLMKEENVLGAGDRYFSAGDQAASLVL